MASFLDTNILLYSISVDPKEARKRDVAQLIVEGGSHIISTQVLQEFYVQATRSTALQPLTHAVAAGFVDKYLRFGVAPMTVPLLQAALALKAKTNFAYWDCAVIAAAIAGGCDVLYTEDMQHGREIAGVRIVNPFLEAA